MIALETFTPEHLDELLNWIKGYDERLLMQWTGSCFLQSEVQQQFSKLLLEAGSPEGDAKLYRAFDPESNLPVGHCQLLRIDPVTKSAVVGRVLIREEMRSNGYGRQMIKAALAEVFDKLQLQEAKLRVFDFNEKAKNCYTACGFVATGIERNWKQVGDESWSVIDMAISRDAWIAAQKEN